MRTMPSLSGIGLRRWMGLDLFVTFLSLRCISPRCSFLWVSKALTSSGKAWHWTSFTSSSSALWRSLTVMVMHFEDLSCCSFLMPSRGGSMSFLMGGSEGFFARSFILSMNSWQIAIALLVRYQLEKYAIRSSRDKCSMDLVASTVAFLTSGSSGEIWGSKAGISNCGIHKKFGPFHHLLLWSVLQLLNLRMHRLLGCLWCQCSAICQGRCDHKSPVLC